MLNARDPNKASVAYPKYINLHHLKLQRRMMPGHEMYHI